MKKYFLFLSLVLSTVLNAADRDRPQVEENLSPLPPEQAAPVKIPLPPLQLPEQSVSGQARFFVKEIKISGNKIIPTATLKDLVKNYEGREISAVELLKIRDILTHYYLEQGYVTSGAVIPDQEIRDGVLAVEIIEGRLATIEVSGNQRLQSSYLTNRLGLETDKPLQIKDLQKRLKYLQQNRLVSRFDASLKPSLKTGEAILNLEVKEENPLSYGFNFNNHRAPSIGAYRGEIWGVHHNVSGWGDDLYGRFGLTEGVKDFLVDYRLPVTRRETRLSLHAERNDSIVVAEPFDQLDIKSESQTYSLSLDHPFYRDFTDDGRYVQFDAGISLEKGITETSLLGVPFSFSAGVQEGRSETSVIRLTQHWNDRGARRIIGFYSSFNFGLDFWGATINDGLDENGNPAIEPDAKFASWIGQFRWLERLPWWNSLLSARADFQFANNDLLPLEKFAIGGVETVRGYRENQLLRDNGFIVSLEWQVPVAKWRPFSIGGSQATDGTIALLPFFDYGRGWNDRLETLDPEYIASVGLGVLWTITANIATDLYWGYALEDVPPAGSHDLQDDGFHFEIRLKY